MSKSFSLLLSPPKLVAFSTMSTTPLKLPLFLLLSKPKFSRKAPFFSLSQTHRLFSTTSTPYPLQYEMIINRPVQPQLPHSRRDNGPEPGNTPDPERGLDSWVDSKLSVNGESEGELEMDKSKRKYYRKRRKRMYGSDSDEDDNSRKNEEGFVELRPEVVNFERLHKREEELYFYDTFAYPWEKDKHYKMVYQLEKKYFPDQCLDKAFLDPKDVKFSRRSESGKKSKSGGRVEEDKRLVFFDEEEEEGEKGDAFDNLVNSEKDTKRDLKERKVEEFFKCLKKVPNKGDEVGNCEPYLAKRNSELPLRWDGPNGTVLLVNKPKGWTSFTVCGKLRRLVKVKKVGHAGTLDPMATGLLIVCIGKATKVVDRYQGMIKGYSGVFRLGEATSTWDADSPIMQREPWEHIKDEDIKKAARSFCGEIWQVPPMFSAIKVGGEKMYEKARRGESIELSPRRISIFEFKIERSLEDRQNLIFRVTCSKGTYIRSLCADFGKALGSSCAHLTALRRDSIGEYKADDAWEFKELEEAITKNYF